MTSKILTPAELDDIDRIIEIFMIKDQTIGLNPQDRDELNELIKTMQGSLTAYRAKKLKMRLITTKESPAG